MSAKDESPGADILRRAIASMRRETEMVQLPPGITIHAIERTQSFGEMRKLEGDLIVELPDRSLHRITGAEVSEWNEALAPFVKHWRLPEE